MHTRNVTLAIFCTKNHKWNRYVYGVYLKWDSSNWLFSTDTQWLKLIPQRGLLFEETLSWKFSCFFYKEPIIVSSLTQPL